MLKLGSRGTALGRRVRCPACRYPNLGINIWCERCRTPLDWQRTAAAPPAAELPLTAAPASGGRAFCPSCGAANAAGDRYCPYCGADMLPRTTIIGRPASPRLRRLRASKVRRIALPRLALPRLALPRLALPRLTRPRLGVPRLALPRLAGPRFPRTIWIVAVVVCVLLIAPLAYVLFPSSRTAAARHSPARISTTSTNSAAATSAQAAAIRGVESTTGLHYAGSCPAGAACLSMLSQTVGQDAAAVLFSTAGTPGGRQCAGYVYRSSGVWHFLDAVCGLPGQLSPLVGREATVHVPGSCANVRDRPSLKGGVVACLNDGTRVHIDGGPTYADGRIWWRQQRGWLAHDFLKAA